MKKAKDNKPVKKREPRPLLMYEPPLTKEHHIDNKIVDAEEILKATVIGLIVSCDLFS